MPDTDTANAILTDPQTTASALQSNVSYYTNTAAALATDSVPQQATKLSIKINKKRLKADESQRKGKAEKLPKAEKPTKSVKVPKAPKAEKVSKVEKPLKVEKPPKPEKPAKISKKKVKNDANLPKPTRVLSRTRKTVNYSEAKSRSPSPSTKAAAPAVASIQSPVQVSQQYNNNEYDTTEQLESQAEQPLIASPKNPAAEHPPIVLRISKVSAKKQSHK